MGEIQGVDFFGINREPLPSLKEGEVFCRECYKVISGKRGEMKFCSRRCEKEWRGFVEFRIKQSERADLYNRCMFV